MMDNDSMQRYPVSGESSSHSSEPVVLRSLVGDPNRHPPRVRHAPPSTDGFTDRSPVTMYTVDTSHQPIPTKNLPRKPQPRVYYIGADSRHTPEDRDVSPVGEQEKRSPLSSPVFLDSQVISQPIFYNIVGARATPRSDRTISRHGETPVPTVYTIVGRPRRPTVDVIENNSPVPAPVPDTHPTLYSMVGSPRVQQPTPPPPKQLIPPTPHFYSIVGSPARTSRGTQVDTMSPSQPVPILYTIVNDAQTPRDMGKENHSPPTFGKKPSQDVIIYAPNNVTHVFKPPQPTLYNLVGKPNTPPREALPNRAKVPARKTTPPPAIIVPTRRLSRSLERTTDPVLEETMPFATTKPYRPPASKEPTYPKAEAILIPVPEDRARPRPEPPNGKASKVAPYQQPHIVDYRSPHGYRTQKPHRERNLNQTPLPVVAGTRGERRGRPPLHEPRYRPDRAEPYGVGNPTSMERSPVSTRTRGALWDNGYQTQTDDDDDSERRANKKKRNYGGARPRAPWIPVW